MAGVADLLDLPDFPGTTLTQEAETAESNCIWRLGSHRINIRRWHPVEKLNCLKLRLWATNGRGGPSG